MGSNEDIQREIIHWLAEEHDKRRSAQAFLSFFSIARDFVSLEKALKAPHLPDLPELKKKMEALLEGKSQENFKEVQEEIKEKFDAAYARYRAVLDLGVEHYAAYAHLYKEKGSEKISEALASEKRVRDQVDVQRRKALITHFSHTTSYGRKQAASEARKTYKSEPIQKLLLELHSLSKGSPKQRLSFMGVLNEYLSKYPHAFLQSYKDFLREKAKGKENLENNAWTSFHETGISKGTGLPLFLYGVEESSQQVRQSIYYWQAYERGLKKMMQISEGKGPSKPISKEVKVNVAKVNKNSKKIR